MTCLEAQSYIMAFIDKKLPDEKVNDFVRHMKYCKNCSEELEIYYTLVVGTRQLDNNEELSKDFKKDMEAELNRVSNKVKNVRRFKISTFGIICCGVIVLFALFYGSCLSKVYNIEQYRIKAMQGSTYFYDCFGTDMEICKTDMIEEYNNKFMIDDVSLEKEENQTERLKFYRKIRAYNFISSDDENEN